MKKFNLSKQLLFIIVIIFSIITISIGGLLPKVLLPIYEQNLYNILKQPLDYVEYESNIKTYDPDIAYIYISDDTLITSSNIFTVINLTPKQIINKVNSDSGKFTFLNKTYYYISETDNNTTKIALTNDKYITSIKTDIINTIFPILIFTFLIVVGLILLWSNVLIKKIEYLKFKIDNLDNDKKLKNYKFYFEDELSSLSESIDEMKETLQIQDEYKNQMYQNISHDFKTPLTVIKSYMEGIEDGIQDKEDGFRIIKEQVNKLEQKVHSLLYLNKLNYYNELKNFEKDKTDVSKVINASVEKFKLQRKDVKWEVNINDKKTLFNGTFDMWEAIVDNLLNNFIRYAKSNIVITINKNKIIFSNDGPNIDENILNDIFTPYKKGIKGEFGLGLSIVKKTIILLGYEINVENNKNGISFIIK